MKRWIFLFFFFLFIFTPRFASADEGWVVDRFQSSIVVEQSGKVRVVETIEVDYKSLEKHGIYREIPYQYGSGGEKAYTELDIASVQQDGSTIDYEESRNNGHVRLKIGDPDKTISGKHTYSIQYTATGILRSFTDYDELYWNVTGNLWPVPINYVEASVALPKDGIARTTCFEGYAKSEALCKKLTENSRTATFTTYSALGEAQGLTVVVGYQKGMVPILTVERPKEFWERFVEWPSLSTLFIVLFAGFVTILYHWHQHGRDYWFAQNFFGKKDEQGVRKPIGAHETVTVEFLPPEKLRPAEMGVLMDERADTHDVVATIVDLATRGFMTITEIPKEWIFGKVDYQLKRKTKDETKLLGYEKKLLSNLFSSGKEVKVSTLKKTFYDDLEKVKKEIYKEVVHKGLFPSDPENIRSNYLGFAIVLLVLGFTGVGLSISSDFIFGADICLAVAVSGLLLLAMARFMPRKTAYGRELYRRARGYQLFIKTAEQHRQKFFESKNMFNEVLPYTIMFGLTAKFAQQMKEIGIEPKTTGWYSGVHPMSIGYFGSSMSDFSNSMSSAIASTPSSSGGFSGGSSGGGFGGGGGGSW